jgi:hypothetical protein
VESSETVFRKAASRAIRLRVISSLSIVGRWSLAVGQNSWFLCASVTSYHFPDG